MEITGNIYIYIYLNIVPVSGTESMFVIIIEDNRDF